MNLKNILLAISLSYIIYSLLTTLLDFVYKNYIVYKERLKKIEDQSIVAYGSKSKTKIDMEVSRLDKIQDELIQAGVHLRAKEYLLIRGFLMSFPALLALVIRKDPAMSLALVFIGFILPPIVLKSKRKKRMELFDEQLGDVIMIISNSLRAGFTFEQAMGSVARDLPDPIGPEFLKIIREVELGERLEVAMEDTAMRMESEDMELMNTAVAIQRQVGGNLADVLDNIGKTIRDRIIMKKKIKAMTAQGEISGKVIGALPVFLLIAVSIANKEYMEPLFTTTFGKILLLLSLVLEIVGFMVIKKIVNIEV